jgi:hypothetical protein
MSGEKSDAEFAKDFGTANGNRTRILALKGLRANRCTIAAWSENDFRNYKGNTRNPPFGRDLKRSAAYAQRCCAAA